MAKVISAENCGLVWEVPMFSPMTKIKYRVSVAADTELEAVAHALNEFPYLAVDATDSEPLEYVRVDITDPEECHSQFVDKGAR